MPRSRALAAIMAAAVVLVIAACGSTDTATRQQAGSGSKSGADTAGFPVTVDNCGTKVTFTAPPSRVVTYSSAHAAELIALGLGDRVVLHAGHLNGSDVPEAWEKLQQIEQVRLSVAPKSEGLLTLTPDFVASARGGEQFQLETGLSREELTASGVNTYMPLFDCTGTSSTSTTVQASYDEITLMGQIFGVPEAAAALVRQMKDQINDVQNRVSGRQPLMVAQVDAASGTSGGAIGGFAQGGVVTWNVGIVNDVIRLAGGTNVYADGSTSFRRISPEEFSVRPVDCFVVNLYDGAPTEDQVRSYFKTAYPQLTASKNDCFAFINDAWSPGAASAAGVQKVAEALHPAAFG